MKSPAHPMVDGRCISIGFPAWKMDKPLQTKLYQTVSVVVHLLHAGFVSSHSPLRFLYRSVGRVRSEVDAIGQRKGTRLGDKGGTKNVLAGCWAFARGSFRGDSWRPTSPSHMQAVL